MLSEVLTDRPDLLIRRMILQPGESTPWHVDRCHRFTVVVRGDRLTIEFRDATGPTETAVSPGQAGWDEPTGTVHRAVNTGVATFEEVVTFYRSSPGEDPQPAC